MSDVTNEQGQGQGRGTEAPPTAPGQVQRTSRSSGMDDYHTVADTVGMVPSLRLSDNLIQAIVISVATIIGAVVGWLVWGGMGALLTAAGGMIVATLISGMVLMVMGWVRLAKRKGRGRHG